MITESIFNVIFKFLNSIIDLLPQVPGKDLVIGLDFVLSTIFDNLDFLEIFIRPTTMKVAIPIVIGIVFFEEIYMIVMWCLRKMPLLGIK